MSRGTRTGARDERIVWDEPSFGKRPLGIAIVALFLSACKGNGGPVSSPVLPPANLERDTGLVQPFHRSSTKIKHIVVIVQENRSFNDLFYGFPGAKTAAYGYGMTTRRSSLRRPARDDVGPRTQCQGILGSLQRHWKNSGHTLPDERLRSRDVDLWWRAAGLPA